MFVLGLFLLPNGGVKSCGSLPHAGNTITRSRLYPQCDRELLEGACRDTDLVNDTEPPQQQQLRVTSARTENSRRSISFQRPLVVSAGEIGVDRDVPADGNMFVVWALGRTLGDGRLNTPYVQIKGAAY